MPHLRNNNESIHVFRTVVILCCVFFDPWLIDSEYRAHGHRGLTVMFTWSWEGGHIAQDELHVLSIFIVGMSYFLKVTVSL